MQRNLILAFALTLLVILIAQPLLNKYGPQPAAKPPATAPQPGTTPPPAPGGVAAAPAAPAGAVPAQQAAAEQETVVENGLYKITFTNRGAQVKSWILKNYKDDGGKPLELVNQAAAGQYGSPLSLWTYDTGLRNQLNSALYVARAGAPCPAQSLCDQIEHSPKSVENSPVELTFLYSEGDLVVRKSFTFDHSYVVRVETSVTRAGQRVQAYPAWPPGFGDQTAPSSYAAARIDYQSNYKIQRLAPKKISGGATVHGPLEWAGSVDQYFSAVFLPDDPQNAALITLHESLKIPKDLQKPDPKDTADVPVLGAAVGDASDVTRERLFVGPKDIDVLGAVPVGAGDTLRDLVDFGYLSFIAKPLFLWLKWTHQH
ncbi:MAG TPA: membrane protein insertase YidC [Terriglobales bacterium]|nr:membrane protein insertase YidC [Terriglobales bacterium]